MAGVIASAQQQYEIIVESGAGGQNKEWFSKVDGNWMGSAGKSKAPGLTATTSFFKTAGSAGAARFTPDIPVEGEYEVFATYPDSGNAVGVIYHVHSASGDKDVVVDQRGHDDRANPKANTWFSLGKYKFTQGKDGYVEIRDPQTGKAANEKEPNVRIYADAVKWVPVGFALPAQFAAKDGALQGTASGMSALPAASAGAGTQQASAATGAPSAMPALSAVGTPAVAAAPASAMPALPGAAGTAVPSTSLPALSSAASPTPAVPALPATASSPMGPSQMSALPPATAPGEAAPPPQLPALGTEGVPASPAAAAPSLPVLPAGQGSAAAPSVMSQLPVLGQPAGSEAASPSAPSAAAPGGLAPLVVSPTPQVVGAAASSQPALTPAAPAGVPSALAGGALPSSVPPAPGVPSLAAVVAQPIAPPSLGTPVAGGTGLAPGTASADNLPWIYDEGSAHAAARKEGKKVLVFFIADGNRAVQKYKTEYFTHPAVRQVLSQFVLQMVNFPLNTKAAYKVKVYGAGSIAVTDGYGDVVGTIPQIPDSPEALAKQLQELAGK